MREEGAEEVVLAGDDVVMPLIREQLPKDLAARVIDVLHLDVRTPEHEVLAATLESFRLHDAQTDAERVRRVLDEHRANGLAVVGAHDTLAALQAGQVDELVIAARPQAYGQRKARRATPRPWRTRSSPGRGRPVRRSPSWKTCSCWRSWAG
jgi:regulator of protease activity HflC (stomatin/prohibitin superfamily)